MTKVSAAKWIIVPAALLTWGGLIYSRASLELAHQVKGGLTKKSVGTTYDPRGFERVDRIVKARESAAFKERLKRGDSADLSWPGLRNAQVSWTWLGVLYGLHNESSYDGDFSWMFSKLNTVIQNSPKTEVYFLTQLAAFFYVIGRDHPGANIIMHETFKRAGEKYNPWFWCGFHSYENLHMSNLASFCYERAAKFPYAPDFLAALSAKLKYGQDLYSSEEKWKLLEKELEPDLIEKIKRARR